MNKIYYSGIGSRETPEKVLIAMTGIATFAWMNGLILRSGGAEGADSAFELGVFDDRDKEIYLPWKGYNNNKSTNFETSKEDFDIASIYHPRWNKLSTAAKNLHARNVQIIMGRSNNTILSKFVVCWTKDGAFSRKTRTKETGGTGLAIALADAQGIPIFNLYYEQSYRRIYETIEGIRDERLS